MKLPTNEAIARISWLGRLLHPQAKNATPLTGIALLLGLLSACTQSQSTSVNLSLKVEPSGRSGTYRVSGTTNLPDRSRIVISGIRYLQPSNDSTPLRPINANYASANYVSAKYANANYAILDREIAEVIQGKWETKLNLWQRNANGSYSEIWQQAQTGGPFRASGQVVFAAIVEPENQSLPISQQIQQQNLQSPLLRFTESGQSYLQVSQALSVSIPAGKTTPLTNASFDQNPRWESRDRLKSPSGGMLVLPKEKQIDAPIAPDGFAR